LKVYSLSEESVEVKENEEDKEETLELCNT